MPDWRETTDRASDWLAESPQHSLVLTGNRRLVRWIRKDFDRLMRTQGVTAWQSPVIREASAWVTERFREDLPETGRRLLPAAAARRLWQEVAVRHADAALLSSTGLARQAQAAWQRIHDWRLPQRAVDEAARSRDERTFARMAHAYRRELERLDCIDAAEVWQPFLDGVAAGRIDVPRRLLLAGFDRLAPVMVALAEALEARGTAIELQVQRGLKADVPLFDFSDEDDEFRAAGAWARDRLAERQDAHVGIVVPNLEQDAGRILRLVRDGVVPGWQLGGGDYRNVVEISYGRRLGEYPAVAAAMLLCRFGAGGLQSSELGVLLRTPFFGTDATAEGHLDLWLRARPDRRWTPAALQSAFGAERLTDDSPCWQALLDRLQAAEFDSRTTDLPSAWAVRIDALLADAGWPGNFTLDSESFQLVSRWHESLNELAATDAIGARITFSGAVQELSAIVAAAVYQPERDGARVSILGPLEAGGMHFDDLLVTRCDAARWPAPSGPLPLIARHLQVENEMPDATPALTLDHARRVLARLAGSADRLCMSWARNRQDKVRSPSHLATALVAERREGRCPPGWYAGSVAGSDMPEAVADTPPAIVGEETISGGARIVDLQRTEPLLAFVCGRLGVRPLDAFEPGITPLLRGNIIHGALHALYSGKPTRDEIVAWQDVDRERRVNRAVSGVIRRHVADSSSVMNRLITMEAARTELLLQRVIDADCGRPEFRIAAVEEREILCLSGARFRLRADRVDTLETGGLLIIDYKTGIVRPLLGKSGLSSYQLALYAITATKEVAGVALMFVTSKGIDYRAAGSEVPGKPMEKDAWLSVLSGWKDEVTGLIERFAAGDARVNVRATAHRDPQLEVLTRVAEAIRVD